MRIRSVHDRMVERIVDRDTAGGEGCEKSVVGYLDFGARQSA